jgi:hypothetical protein
MLITPAPTHTALFLSLPRVADAVRFTAQGSGSTLFSAAMTAVSVATPDMQHARFAGLYVHKAVRVLLVSAGVSCGLPRRRVCGVSVSIRPAQARG